MTKNYVYNLLLDKESMVKGFWALLVTRAHTPDNKKSQLKNILDQAKIKKKMPELMV